MIKIYFVYIILLKSFQVFWLMSWFQVEIGGWIYQNCLERFRIFHRPSAGIACMYKECFGFKEFCKLLVFFITSQKYVNTELDKTEMLMNLKHRTLSTEMEYYQEIWKKIKTFQNIVAIFKINSIGFNFFFFLLLFVRFLGFVVVAY